MRKRRSLKNITYNTGFNLVYLFLGILSRGVFLSNLHADYLGVAATAMNLVGILNVVELGLSTAIGYALYKPLVERDTFKIRELIRFIQCSYQRIAALLLLVGLGVFPFLSMFFHTTLPSITVWGTYLLFLGSTVGSYFITYQQVLPTADQKSYILTRINGSVKIGKTLLQLGAVFYLHSYLIWVCLEAGGTLVSYLLMNRRIKRDYPWLRENMNASYEELRTRNQPVLVDLRNVIFHEISTAIVLKTDSVLIAIFTTVKEVALYANYMLIVSQLLTIMGNIFWSFSTSIGNLIAEGKERKTHDIFWQLYILEFFTGVCVTFTLYKTMNPFIHIWIGNTYLLSKGFLLILVLNFFVSVTRQTIVSFKMGYGIFSDIYAPMIEGAINLSMSLLFGWIWGITGVIFGTLISYLIVVIPWHPYILFKRGFQKSSREFFQMYGLLLVLAGIGVGVTNHWINQVEFPVIGYGTFCLFGFLCMTSIGLVLFSLFLVLPSFRVLLRKLVGQVNGLRKEHGNANKGGNRNLHLQTSIPAKDITGEH